jgi:hypothetical protein
VNLCFSGQWLAYEPTDPDNNLAWARNTDVKPSLISNYNGTPVCYGSTYETHLQSIAADGGP